MVDLGSGKALAGFALGSIGTYSICTNLPVSETKALEEAKRAMLAEEGSTGSPGGESMRRNVELHVWTSAFEVANVDRKERRGEGLVFLVSGIISLIWGITVLYNSTSTPNRPGTRIP